MDFHYGSPSRRIIDPNKNGSSSTRLDSFIRGANPENHVPICFMKSIGGTT